MARLAIPSAHVLTPGWFQALIAMASIEERYFSQATPLKFIQAFEDADTASGEEGIKKYRPQKNHRGELSSFGVVPQLVDGGPQSICGHS